MASDGGTSMRPQLFWAYIGGGCSVFSIWFIKEHLVVICGFCLVTLGIFLIFSPAQLTLTSLCHMLTDFVTDVLKQMLQRKQQNPTAAAEDPAEKVFDQALLHHLEACIQTTYNTTWDEVIGLRDVKNALQEEVVNRLQTPVISKDLPIGVLLYGPPGTGKSFLGQCIASSAGCTFFSVTASDLVSRFVGDSEKAVAALFHLAQKRKPSIIFVDEIDSILTRRMDAENECFRRIKTEFLTQWQGMEKTGQCSQVIVMGSTNRPMDLDVGAVRRFELQLYVPLPDLEDRKEMFKRYQEKSTLQVSLNTEDIEGFANDTDGYSAHDISIILSKTKPSSQTTVTKDDIVFSKERWRKRRTVDVKTIQELEAWRRNDKGVQMTPESDRQSAVQSSPQSSAPLGDVDPLLSKKTVSPSPQGPPTPPPPSPATGPPGYLVTVKPDTSNQSQNPSASSWKLKVGVSFALVGAAVCFTATFFSLAVAAAIGVGTAAFVIYDRMRAAPLSDKTKS